MFLSEEDIRKIVRDVLVENINEVTLARIGQKSPTFGFGKSKSDLADDSINGTTENSNSLDDLDPKASKIKDFVNALNSKGYNVIITSTYRDMKKQASLTSNQGQDVAKAGYSPHNFGLGIDLNIKWKGKSDNKDYHLKMNSSNKEWLKIIGDKGPVPYKNYQLRWGGNFKKRDAVHFDVYPQLKNPETGKTGEQKPGEFSSFLRKKAGNADKKYSEIIQ